MKEIEKEADRLIELCGNNAERILLLGLVKEDIRKAQLEKDPAYYWDGENYKKPRRKYGINKLTTLYELETKLSKRTIRK